MLNSNCIGTFPKYRHIIRTNNPDNQSQCLCIMKWGVRGACIRLETVVWLFSRSGRFVFINIIKYLPPEMSYSLTGFFANCWLEFQLQLNYAWNKTRDKLCVRLFVILIIKLQICSDNLNSLYWRSTLDTFYRWQSAVITT